MGPLGFCLEKSPIKFLLSFRRFGMKVYAYLDKVENGIGYLVIPDGESVFSWPAAFLPEGSKEGDWISFLINRDENKQKDELEEMKSLHNKLLGE